MGSGAIDIISAGICPEELVSILISGITKVWSIETISNEKTHSQIIVSSMLGSQILEFNEGPEICVKVADSVGDFLTDVATIYSLSVSKEHFVQITSSSIVMLEKDTYKSVCVYDNLKDKGSIVVAHSRKNYIVVFTTENIIMLLKAADRCISLIW